MVQQTAAHPGNKRNSSPAWDVARLFPDQGSWDEEDYLALSTNHLVELSDGYVEVLPMPTMTHQAIVQYLSNLLLAFASMDELGRVLFAALRVRLRPGKFAEPDVVFMSAAHQDRMGDRYWDGTDLVMEVVSESEQDRQRDYVAKRQTYAAAGIAEYWIVSSPVARHGAVASGWRLPPSWRVSSRLGGELGAAERFFRGRDGGVRGEVVQGSRSRLF